MDRTLEQLDGEALEQPTRGSHVVQGCHRLSRVPLRAFTVEHLRLMLGQTIVLRFLVPLALERLDRNPLVAGAFYPGDLLVNVLTLSSAFWRAHPALRVT